MLSIQLRFVVIPESLLSLFVQLSSDNRPVTSLLTIGICLYLLIMDNISTCFMLAAFMAMNIKGYTDVLAFLTLPINSKITKWKMEKVGYLEPYGVYERVFISLLSSRGLYEVNANFLSDLHRASDYYDSS